MMLNGLRRVATIPTPGTAEFRDWAAGAGHDLAATGATPMEPTLSALAGLARRWGVAAVSSSVLADRHQPEVARARALARVVTALVEVSPAARAADVAA